MPNQQLIDYIKHTLVQDYSNEEQIRETLLAQGWQEAEIGEAFAAVKATSPVATLSDSPDSVSSGKLPEFSFLFKRTFGIFFDRWMTFLGISVIPYVIAFILAPILFFQGLDPGITPGGMPSFQQFAPFAIVVFVILAIVQFFEILSLLALVFAVKERERKVGIIESYRLAKDTILSSILIFVLTMLAVFAGFFFFVAPGIILSIWFMFGIYVLIYEDARGRQALFRSRQLARGNLSGILARNILFGIILMALFFPFVFIIGLPITILIPPLSGPLNQILNQLLTPLIISFPVIFSALIYEHLARMPEKQTYIEPSKRFRNITTIFIIIGVILAVALVYISISFFISELRQEWQRLERQKQLEKQFPAGKIQKESEVTSWTKYVNEEFGFELEYPAGWNMRSYGPPNDWPREEIAFAFAQSKDNLQDSWYSSSPYFWVKVYPTTNAVDYAEFQDRISRMKSIGQDYLRPARLGNEINGVESFGAIEVQHGDYVYELKLGIIPTGGAGAFDYVYTDISSKVLSSFKFLR